MYRLYNDESDFLDNLARILICLLCVGWGGRVWGCCCDIVIYHALKHCPSFPINRSMVHICKSFLPFYNISYTNVKDTNITERKWFKKGITNMVLKIRQFPDV